jgi:hypothetical protein
MAMSSAIFCEIQCQKMKYKYTIAKKKYSANFIDYLDFPIGLKYETITKMANKIQQFPVEIIQIRSF